MSQINGHPLSEEEGKEMLEAVQFHLVNEFSLRPEVADLLTPAEVVAMFESQGTYPQMYQQLGERLTQRYLQESHVASPAPWLADEQGEAKVNWR